MPSIVRGGGTNQTFTEYFLSVNVDTMPVDGWITSISQYVGADDSGETAEMKLCVYVNNARKFVSTAFSQGYNSGVPVEKTSTGLEIKADQGSTIKWGRNLNAQTGTTVLARANSSNGGHNRVIYDVGTFTAPTTLTGGTTVSDATTDGDLVYVSNLAPSTPAQVAPASGATGVSLTPTFQGTNNHPAGDSSFDSTSAVHLQIQNVGTSLLEYDATFAPSTSTPGATWSTVSPITLAGATPYQWRIRHADSFGVYSAWSGYRTFTTLSGPAAPTATAPSGKINAISGFNYSYLYSHPTPLNANAVQILVKSATGTQLYDSGTVVISPTIASGVTRDTAEFHADLAWGTSYQHQARFRDTNNTWGPYSTLTAFQTDKAPNAPTDLVPTGGQDLSTAILTCKVSDPDGDAISLAQCEVVNVATGAIVAGYPKSMTVDAAAGTATFNASADLTLGTEYKWRARANDGLGPGYGAYSAYAFFTYVVVPTVALLAPAPSRTNLVWQPSAEYDPALISSYWTETNRSGTNFIDRVSSLDAGYGEWSWEGTAAATGDNRLRTPLTTIDATKPYLFQVLMKKYSGTATTHFAIECYTSADVLISTVYPTSILTANATNVASVWTRYGGIIWPIGSGNSPAFPATTAKVRVVWTPSRTTAAVVRADGFFVGQVALVSSADWTTIQPWHGYADPDLASLQGYKEGGYVWTLDPGDSPSQNLAVVTSPPGNVVISYTHGTAKGADRLYLERWTGSVWASVYDSGFVTTSPTRTVIPFPTDRLVSETRYRVRVEARDTALTVGSSPWVEFDVTFAGPSEPIILSQIGDAITAQARVSYQLSNTPTEAEFAGVEFAREAMDGSEDLVILDLNTAIGDASFTDHYPLSGVAYRYKLRQIKQEGLNRVQGRWAVADITVDYAPFAFIKDAEEPETLVAFETRLDALGTPEQDVPVFSTLSWGQTKRSHTFGIAELNSGEVVAEFYQDATIFGQPDAVTRYDKAREIVFGHRRRPGTPVRRTVALLLQRPDTERVFVAVIGPARRQQVFITVKAINFNYEETNWSEDFYEREGWT